MIRYAAIASGGFLLLATLSANNTLVRQNPVPDTVYPIYVHPQMRELVDTAANIISDSTGTLMPFMEKLAALRRDGEGTVSILHVGDSHIQAGHITGRLRHQFQRDFGDAGRGIVIPLRMAGTNEPNDYSIATPYGVRTRKATDKGIEGTLGFTGISATFETPYNEFKIWSKSPFNSATVFHHPAAPALCEPDRFSTGSYCTIDNTPTATRIFLSQTVDSLTVSGFTTAEFNDPTFYGFSLENGMPGVIYHSIGVNGAAFEHFINNTSLPSGGASDLCPDVIIVSLGTNNCFGANFRQGDFYNVVDGFIRNIKKVYAGVPLLLVTPMECCTRRTARGRRTYSPNPNVKAAASIIAQATAANEVACWDLYAATGGGGAMGKWFSVGLANTDRIHLTENGYVLQGDMLYEAFAKYYNQFINRE